MVYRIPLGAKVRLLTEINADLQARIKELEKAIGTNRLYWIQRTGRCELRIKYLEGTLKELRGHLVDGLDDDAFLVLVIDRALATMKAMS
jgi:hypothetical protein